MEFYKQLFIFLSFFALSSAKFFISEFFDFRELKISCVAFYLKKIYNLSSIDENLIADCVTSEINDFERSISEFVVKEIEEEISKGQRINNERGVSECAINLLEFYHINAVFKVLAYAHNLLNVSANPQKSCENVVKFTPLNVTEDCDGKALTVKLGNEKSFTRFRHCLNELFRTYRVDKIVFDEDLGEIFERKFGKHLVEFLRQLSVMAVKYCGNNESLEVERIEDLAQIDIFGFTEPSVRVEKCIIEEVQKRVENSFKISIELKIVIEIIFKCLEKF
jgi:hypothetical protein